MKSALCLFGIIGGTQGKNGQGALIDVEACYKSYLEHIIQVNNCDVFIHSWSVESKKQLLKLYKPKDSLIEPQMDFSERASEWKNPEGCFRNFSRWYSTKKVVELKAQYEEEHGYK